MEHFNNSKKEERDIVLFSFIKKVNLIIVTPKKVAFIG